MTSKELNDMCRNGKVNEAMELATASLSAAPDNLWEQRKMGWVITYALKDKSESNDTDGFSLLLKQFFSLDQIKPEAESMVYDVLAFRIGSAMNDDDSCSELFPIIRPVSFQPSDGYSYMLKRALKNKSWRGLGTFIEWWNLSKLQESDYVPTEYNHRKTMALAEQAYITYAKVLLQQNDLNKIRLFEPQLATLSDKYPDMVYPDYFCGKLLLAMDAEDEQLLKEFLPFARKKSTQFWVWQLLAEIYEDAPDKRLACLLQAVHCPSKEDFLGKVRMELAFVLAERGDYERAKYQVDKVAHCYSHHGWGFPDDLRELTQASWMTGVKADSTDAIDYRKITDEILGPDFKRPLQSRQSKRPFPTSGETKIISGTVTSNRAGTALFVKGNDVFAFIPKQKEGDLRVGDEVSATIVQAFDKKKNQMGWRCIFVEKK